MTRTPVRSAAARRGRGYPRAPRARTAAVIVTAVACLLTTSASAVRTAPPSHLAGHAAAARPASAAAVPARVAPEPLIVPKPVSMAAGRGRYALTRQTRIVVAAGPRSALAVAADLAGDLRPATGYPLPVVSGSPQAGDIALVLGTSALHTNSAWAGSISPRHPSFTRSTSGRATRGSCSTTRRVSPAATR